MFRFSCLCFVQRGGGGARHCTHVYGDTRVQGGADLETELHPDTVVGDDISVSNVGVSAVVPLEYPVVLKARMAQSLG